MRPCFSYCEQYCCEHGCSKSSSRSCFQFFWVDSQKGDFASLRFPYCIFSHFFLGPSPSCPLPGLPSPPLGAFFGPGIRAMTGSQPRRLDRALQLLPSTLTLGHSLQPPCCPAPMLSHTAQASVLSAHAVPPSWKSLPNLMLQAWLGALPDLPSLTGPRPLCLEDFPLSR